MPYIVGVNHCSCHHPNPSSKCFPILSWFYSRVNVEPFKENIVCPPVTCPATDSCTGPGAKVEYDEIMTWLEDTSTRTFIDLCIDRCSSVCSKFKRFAEVKVRCSIIVALRRPIAGPAPLVVYIDCSLCPHLTLEAPGFTDWALKLPWPPHPPVLHLEGPCVCMH